MIIKGNLHSYGPKLLAYLLRGKADERAELGGHRGVDDFGADLRGAVAFMQRFAMATSRSAKPWFHAQTRLAPGEHLTREQWEHVLEQEEQQLGLQGLPCIWSYHIDRASGETHSHCMWFRIDPETGYARDPGLFKRRLIEVARAIESALFLQRVRNTRELGSRASVAERKEFEESRRLDTDCRGIRNAILNCFEQSEGGRQFQTILEHHGLVLATGNRENGWIVIDQAGGHHALNKRLLGVTSAGLLRRFADLDRSDLSSVTEIQRQRREGRRSYVQRGEQEQSERTIPPVFGQGNKDQSGQWAKEMLTAQVGLLSQGAQSVTKVTETDPGAMPYTVARNPETYLERLIERELSKLREQKMHAHDRTQQLEGEREERDLSR